MRCGLILAFSILIVGGCGEGQRMDLAAPDVEEHESGGVRFLVHSDGPGRLFQLGDAPFVVVGTDEESALFRVRGGILNPDLSFTVANSGTSEVFLFGPAGQLLATVGGEGEGPEEYTNILWIQGHPGGDFSVYDAGNRRVNRYAASGDFLSSKPVTIDPEDPPSEDAMVGQGFHLGVTEGHRLLSVPWPAAILDGERGILPLRAELRNYDPDLSGFAAVDTVQLRTWYQAPQPEGPPIEQVLEAPIFVFSANGPRMAYSEAAGHRITILDEGVLETVIIEDRSRIPFHPDSLPQYVSQHADSLPSYRRIQVDRDRRVWVQPATGPEQALVRWRVFSADGRSKSEIDLPTSSLVLDAYGNHILLLERDSFDVETVSVRALR